VPSRNGTHRLPSELDTVFVECRGPLRHAWSSVNPPPPRRNTLSAAGEQHSFLCDRCGSMKHEVWSRRTGQLMTRWYVKPAGYTTISREFRADDLRLELIRRWNDSPPELLAVEYEE